MRLLITDANIFIDLANLNAIKWLFALPVEVHTSDVVWAEITAHHLAIQPFPLHIHEIEEAEMPALLELVQQHPQLGFADCSVLYLTAKLGGTCVTGDGALRKQVSNHGHEVRGILFIIEQFAQHKICTVNDCIDILHRLKQTNARLPLAEIDRMLDRLQQAL